MNSQFTAPLIASILILGLIGILPIFNEASALNVKICDDETISTGIFQNIQVAEGKSCTITGDTIIEKNLTADGAIDVIVDGAPLVVIGGNVVIKNSQFVSVENSQIDKNLILKNNSGDDIIVTFNQIGKNLILKENIAKEPPLVNSKFIKIENNQVGRDLILIDNLADDDFFTQQNTIAGNLIQRGTTVENNDIFVVDNTIGGNLNFKDNSSSGGETDIWRNNISGNVLLKSNSFGEVGSIQDNVVQGKFIIKDHGLEDYSRMSFSNNSIGKDLNIIKNTQRSIDVSGSIVGGDIKIIKNHSEGFSVGQNEANGKIVVKKNIVEPFLGGSQGILFFNNISSEKIIISDNVVESDLFCRDNVPDPTGKKNIVGGSKLEQCNSL